MTSVLDLSIEKQKELAALDGFGGDLPAWQSQTKKELEDARKLAKKLDQATEVSPNKEAIEARWATEY